MDFEKEIKKVTHNLNTELHSKKEKVYFLDGHREPFETYKIKLSYKNCDIIMTNTTGVQASGNITCHLSNNAKLIEFEIDSISHFMNLFLRKNSRFKVKCKNKNFNFYLKNKALKELSELSKKTAFDPYIFSKKQGDKNLIITEYHLAFENSPYAIEPLLKFYKSVIDFLLSN
ncbi:hypothetical protein [Tenacibaculum crassostreae]|uniref:hypothetical protein n=1 Tax=Tenacibaculum crassostreae TaxID=502683 RepID=UPI003893D958